MCWNISTLISADFAPETERGHRRIAPNMYRLRLVGENKGDLAG